jgi:uncharacterized membrane protein
MIENLRIRYFAGILYLLYGVVKITVGLAIFLLSINTISKMPILKLFAKAAADKTFAGRMYEYVLLAFGVFSLLNGLSLLELLSPKVSKYFENKYTEYTVFIILGVILTVFYSLVLYTDLPIQKNTADYDHYRLLGLFGGISFLVMPFFNEFLRYVFPIFRNLSYVQQSIWVIGITILLFIIIEMIYRHYKKQHKTVVQALPPVYQEEIENIKQTGESVVNKIVK